jgi:aldose 1-epimerase
MLNKIASFGAALALAACAFMVGCHHNQVASSSPAGQKPQALIGGMPVVTLTRNTTENGENPEFVSMAILPGRGMNVYKINADLPGKGEVPVLWAPSLDELSAKMTGKPPDDLDGDASFSCCGAFLVPYVNRVLGKVSPDGTTITTEWQGKTLVLPANWHASNKS